MVNTVKIAIVDDDEGVRTSLVSLVRSLGYQAVAYASGLDFLSRPAEEEPACMPRMMGDELQRELALAGRCFPIIFMTAFPTNAVKDRVMMAGAHCYLTKPADGETIIRCIESALKSRADLH